MRFKRQNPHITSLDTSASKSETDWARLDAVTDADIDLSDCPEVTPEMFAGAVVRRSITNRANVMVTVDYLWYAPRTK